MSLFPQGMNSFLQGQNSSIAKAIESIVWGWGEPMAFDCSQLLHSTRKPVLN